MRFLQPPDVETEGSGKMRKDMISAKNWGDGGIMVSNMATPSYRWIDDRSIVSIEKVEHVDI